jgi:hypothetical protein
MVVQRQVGSGWIANYCVASRASNGEDFVAQIGRSGEESVLSGFGFRNISAVALPSKASSPGGISLQLLTSLNRDEGGVACTISFCVARR